MLTYPPLLLDWLDCPAPARVLLAGVAPDHLRRLSTAGSYAATRAPAIGDEPLTVAVHPARIIYTILCRIRQKHADQERVPLPYEQAILIPEPVWPDYSVALTEDGKRFLALEPSPDQSSRYAVGARLEGWQPT